MTMHSSGSLQDLSYVCSGNRLSHRFILIIHQHPRTCTLLVCPEPSFAATRLLPLCTHLPAEVSTGITCIVWMYYSLLDRAGWLPCRCQVMLIPKDRGLPTLLAFGQIQPSLEPVVPPHSSSSSGVVGGSDHLQTQHQVQLVGVDFASAPAMLCRIYTWAAISPAAVLALQQA